jgi:hypothetical protein
MTFGLPARNQVWAARTVYPHHEYDMLAQLTNALQTHFAVVFAHILAGHHRLVKHRRAIGEINTVLG